MVVINGATYRCDVLSPDQGALGRPRFPAVDPEPPPRPWWWRVAVCAGVLAVAAGVAAAVAFWPFSARPARTSAAARRPGLPAAIDRGRIVTLNQVGYLALSDPDGTRVTKVSALGAVGQSVAAAPDNRYLSLGNGQLAVVRNGATLAAYPSKVPLSSQYAAAFPDSFADHDRDLIMLLNYGSGIYSVENPVTAFSLATGSSSSLGIADSAAGDPQSVGAFVSVAAQAEPSATAQQISPDSRVELRDAGRPAVLLATAGALNHALGQSRNNLVQLVPYPDRQGDKIAVVVQPIAPSPDGSGIVVLSRAGRMLAAAPTPFGVQGIPAWSPSGAALAYASTGSAGPAVVLWTIGQSATAITLPPTPSASGSYGWCVWSPDGGSVICASTDAAAQGDWVVASGSTGVKAAVRGPGLPVAWLPGGGST
jgi:hypothetical protein